MATLHPDFFLDADVERTSRNLLGKHLFTLLPLDGTRSPNSRKNRVVTGGIIVETEAYAGVEDRASHAYGNRRTRRTETMYCRGGVAYVYLCYGVHSLLNVVTAEAGVPHAVLIRAILPTCGIRHMLARRGLSRVGLRLGNGPGSLTSALGIDVSLDGADLTGNTIWIEDHGIETCKRDIVAAPRVGVDYAGPHAGLHRRFFLKHNPWVSRS